ncbi:MAG: hypothetical protein HY701_03780 [Gemmatimonadetes bacterium]|nr:hypothetical protein [Gemmatimonadota bacterium]
MTDILTPVVSYDRLHPGFRSLIEYSGHEPARQLIRRLFASFVDRDGNFVEQFQTTGFDQRTWELFLFALFQDMGASFDWTHSAPDFVLTYRGQGLIIEATTANPPGGGPLAPTAPTKRSPQELRHQMEHEYPIRLGSALYSKLQKRYWELPHVTGKPVILAIEDFHEPGSLYHSEASLWQYLYGIRGKWYFNDEGVLQIEEIPVDKHAHGAKEIPSAFFDLPNVEHISAVIFANSGTITKFNRMGFLMGYGDPSKILMIRTGTCYDHSPNAAEPLVFRYVVGHPDSPPETWGQGPSLFHNPNALCPLPHDLLPLAYHYHDGSRLRSFLPDFFPYGSQTQVLAEAGEAPA